VAGRVLVQEAATQHPGDDLHVLVRVGVETAARRDNVVVVGPQQPMADVGRVVVVTERERVLRVEPVGLGHESVSGPSYVDFLCDRHLSRMPDA